MVSRSLTCLCRFLRCGYRILFLICHSTPALSVVLWVCSFIKCQTSLAALVDRVNSTELGSDPKAVMQVFFRILILPPKDS